MYRTILFGLLGLSVMVQAQEASPDLDFMFLNGRDEEKLGGELNLAAAQGYRVRAGSSYDGVLFLVLEKQDAGTYTYQIASVDSPTQFKGEMAKLGNDGFRLLPNTLMIQGKLVKNHEILAVVEKPAGSTKVYDNLVLMGEYDQNMAKALGKAKAQNYVFLGCFSPKEGVQFAFLEKEK